MKFGKILVLLLFFLPFSFETISAENGTCGSNVTYNIEENTISFSRFDANSNAYWKKDCTNVFRYDPDITRVIILDTIILPADSFCMFNGCKYVHEMYFSKFDASNVVDMTGMFGSCHALEYLDTSGWDTSNVTSMYWTFNVCRSLESLDLSHWDTSNVVNMRSMFAGSTSLTRLNLSGWNTSNVTNMYNMFGHCRSLTALDMSGWDTSNVTNMIYMFGNCRSLTDLDLSGWDTSNLTDMSLMFEECNNLGTLVLGEKTVVQNIFTSLPKYNDPWFYIDQGPETVEPLALGSSLTDATLFTDYDYTQMAGTWTTDQGLEFGVITYDANEGEGKMSSQTVPLNRIVSLHPNEFIREGYSFRGWNTMADGSGEAYEDEAKITINADLTLYAQWKLIEVEIQKEALFKNVMNDGRKTAPADLKDGEQIRFSVVLKEGSNVFTSERYSMALEDVRGKYKTSLKLTFTDVLPELTNDILVEVKGLPEYVTGYYEPVYGLDEQTHKYYLSAKAWINKKGKIEITLIWTDEDTVSGLDGDIAIYPLPEDEIGAYAINDNGEKEYLIYQTYDICMQYLGSDELCQSNERCYHK